MDHNGSVLNCKDLLLSVHDTGRNRKSRILPSLSYNSSRQTEEEDGMGWTSRVVLTMPWFVEAEGTASKQSLAEEHAAVKAVLKLVV